MSQKPILGIMMGDPSGIGPELVAKACASGFLAKACRPVLIGDERVMKAAFELIGASCAYELVRDIADITWSHDVVLYDLANIDMAAVHAGEMDPVCGKACGDMLTICVDLAKQKAIDGFVFAPLNKAAMKAGGYHYESEHELFVELFAQTEPCGIINVLDSIWTTRATSHIPILDVPSRLTREEIIRAIRLADSSMRRAGYQNPRIAVAALNPHAGENGTCGREEIDLIAPVIDEMKASGVNLAGPLPSDIVFIKTFNGEYDAVVTMYHDQGQIAMKLKGFDYGVTVAGGFPVPITTPAHGCAPDIAGKGVAKTSAFENAVSLAVKMATNKL